MVSHKLSSERPELPISRTSNARGECPQLPLRVRVCRKSEMISRCNDNRWVDYRPPDPAPDAGAAAWIAPRLVEQFGAVCRTIPAGFDAYARILHPADPGRPAPLRWAEVAATNGRIMHALAQFERITTPAPGHRVPTARHYVQAPMTGDLAPNALRALCAILARYTPAAARCWFAVWDGWGDLTSERTAVSFTSSEPPPPTRSAPPQRQLDLRAPRFETPGRGYYLFTGPIDDALRIGSWPTADWFLPRSPNLFWPDDRSWCVATEIDFDSTLLGGPPDLIDDVLRRDDLEAWPVGPLDSLAWEGDTINQP
jgi:hypothetical protein